MKRIAVIPNEKKDIGLKVTKKLLGHLKGRAKVFLDSSFISYAPLDAEFLAYDELFLNADLVISLGGDGTILSISKDAAKKDIPIFGINMGKIGFLAEVETGEIEESIDLLLNDKLKLLERMMLDAHIVRDGEVKESFTALNDIVITRSSFAKMLDIKIEADEKQLESFSSDGVVVSTPTGSTAYALSAGGPVLEPEIMAMVVTPICSHSLRSKSVVLSDSRTLKIKIDNLKDSEAMLVADGKCGAQILLNDEIIVKKSVLKTKLFKLKEHSFYEVLRQKLSGR